MTLSFFFFARRHHHHQVSRPCHPSQPAKRTKSPLKFDVYILPGRCTTTTSALGCYDRRGFHLHMCRVGVCKGRDCLSDVGVCASVVFITSLFAFLESRGLRMTRKPSL